MFYFQQKIVVNETGEKLRLAWQWKIEGETDSSIRKRLLELGVTISKQRLSDMWRNPFYCGIISHKMLDGEIVKGNHEALISKETFLKVQDIISQNNQGYSVEKKNTDRPLAGTILCPICSSKLTGYFNKQRGRHYYKCNLCNGVSINADTPYAKRYKNNYGAHNLFIELLDTFHLDEKYNDLFILQMEKMLSNTDKASKSEEALYKKQLTELNNKKEKLHERFAFGDIEQEMYYKFLSQIEGKITELEAKFDISGIDISNIKANLNRAIDFTQNVSKYWSSGTLNHKQRIQKLVFPEGIHIDTKKRQYLTSKINLLFREKRVFIGNTEGDKKEKPTEIGGSSSLVAGVGLEPTTFGL
ncbi:MAG: recombinase family protein [Bacteroidales bacterium]|nr:recombinase family protein [Bacteroidales bacterium]